MNRRKIFVAGFAVLLSGCNHYFRNEVKESVEPLSIAESVKQRQNALKDIEIDGPTYATEAYRLADRACSDYFDKLIYASNKLRMGKADVTAIGVAAATIMALAKSSPQDIGIAAAEIGLTTAVLDNVQQYLFLTPYPEETRDLVKAAMLQYRTDWGPATAVTLESAQDHAAGYAQICSYSNIAALAKQAISKAKVVNNNKPKPMFTEADLAAIATYKAKVGFTTEDVSDEDLVYFEILTEGGQDAEFKKGLYDNLEPAIQAVIGSFPGFTAQFKASDAVGILQNMASTNAAYTARIAELKAVYREQKAKQEAKQKADAAAKALALPKGAIAAPLPPQTIIFLPPAPAPRLISNPPHIQVADH